MRDDTPSEAPSRTLFLCALRQETAFSSGGSVAAEHATDMDCARDGEGRVVLPGSGLAGALLATARGFLDVPPEVSRGLAASGDLAQPPSLWRFDNAYPFGKCAPLSRDEVAAITELRPGSGQRQDTRASATNALFDMETLPHGLTWRFLLDVVRPAGDPTLARRARAQAALALLEWARGRCWLGRRVARGLGWFTLVECHIIDLPRSEAAADAWPSSRPADIAARFDYVRGLAKVPGAVEHHADDASATLQSYLRGREHDCGDRCARRAWVRWPLQIAVGEYRAPGNGQEPRGYGLDALSLLGHGAVQIDPAAVQENWIRVAEQEWGSFAANCSPGAAIAMTREAGTGAPAPFIPGSAIAGAFRHHLSRSLRSDGLEILDPVTGERYGRRRNGAPSADASGAEGPDPPETDTTADVTDPASELFGGLGKTLHPSRLLISDAHFDDEAESWRIALIENVALDEFRQSPYGSAKFDRLAILQGRWTGCLVQEIRAPADGTDWRQHIERCTAPALGLLADANQRRIGLGGAEFRGFGHLELACRGVAQWACAGEAWQQLDTNPTSAKEDA